MAQIELALAKAPPPPLRLSLAGSQAAPHLLAHLATGSAAPEESEKLNMEPPSSSEAAVT